MTSIGPTSTLIAQIRARAAAWQKQEPARYRSSEAGDGQRSPATPQDWSASLAQAVVAIAPDDPQRERKAFRAFLQTVLSREFGIRSVEDPAFQSLIDQVQGSMELDEPLRRAMEEAGRLLLGGRG